MLFEKDHHWRVILEIISWMVDFLQIVTEFYTISLRRYKQPPHHHFYILQSRFYNNVDVGSLR